MKYLKTIVSILSLLVLFACKHDNIEGLLGPDLKQSGLLCPEDDFKINPANELPENIDFLVAPLTEDLLLTEQAQWEYGFIGTNGARFSATGFGDKAEVNWAGNTTTPFLFKAGDTVRSYYKVTCLDTIFDKKIKVLSAKTYDHTLISDFDGQGLGEKWTNVTSQLDNVDTLSIAPVPQKDNFLRLNATFQDRGSFLGQAQTKLKTDLGIAGTAEEVYINALIKGSPNTTFEFRVFQSTTDQYTISRPIDWEGWKLVSIKYSDFGDLIPARLGKIPSTINTVRVVVRYTDGNTQPDYTVDLDFLSFTTGKPLEL